MNFINLMIQVHLGKEAGNVYQISFKENYLELGLLGNLGEGFALGDSFPPVLYSL